MKKCRYVPRVCNMPGHQSNSGAHMISSAITPNVVFYCEKCNKSVKRELAI